MTSGRKAEGDIRSLVNARGLQFECARMLHEGLFVTVLFHRNKRMIRREKDRSRFLGLRLYRWTTL